MSEILSPSFSAMCPHAGTLSQVPTNTRVNVDGAPAAVAADTFPIAGCAFVTPVGAPAPCALCQWLVTAVRVKVMGQPVVTQASTGLCTGAAPPGPPNVISTQMRVKAQ